MIQISKAILRGATFWLAFATIAVQAQEQILILSSLGNEVPWQAKMQQGILGRYRESRMTADPHAEIPRLYFETAYQPGFNKSLEARADVVATQFEGVFLDQVVAIGPSAAAIYELIADRLRNPSVEYVDTPWKSAYGLDADSLRQPEAIYNSIRELVPELTRLVYVGSKGVQFGDLILFDDRHSIEFESYASFASQQQFEAVLKNLKEGDVVLIDRSSLLIGSELHLPFETALEVVEYSAVPVLVASANAVQIDGVVGGRVTDPFELGRAIFDLVQGGTPDLSRLHKNVYNQGAVERFGLNLTAVEGPIEIRGQKYMSITFHQLQRYATIAAFCVAAFFFAWLSRERRRSRQLTKVGAENARLYRSLQHRQISFEVALGTAGIAYFQYRHSDGVFSPEERFLKLYGHSDDKQLDLQQLQEQIYPEDLDKVLAFRSRAYSRNIDDAGETDYSVVYRIYHKQTGELVWLKAFSRQVTIDGELLTLGCIFSVDAEMQAKAMFEKASDSARQALNELRGTAKQGGIGLMRHNLRADSMNVNEVFRELFDLPKDEYPTIHFNDFCSRIPADIRDVAVARALAARKRHETTVEPVRMRRRDGSMVYVRVHLKNVFEKGEAVEIAGSFIDVTHQMQLSQKLKQLAAERQIALEDLERRQQAQQQMFAVIGHELRTPAAALKMMLDEQKQQLGASSVAELPFAKDIHDSAEHLMNVLDDLRAAVEPELLKNRSRENASPLELVEGCLAPVSDRLKAANLRVQLRSNQAASEQLAFDTKGLRQIVMNLVKNAAIHSGATELSISLDLLEQKGSEPQLKIELADNGKGIAEAQWASIFEPFERGDTEADGTGLGLHICRELARASGGELALCASIAGGCLFTVTLPVAVSNELSEAVEPLAAVEDLAGKRVLFAEDNLTLRMLTEQLLKRLDTNYSVAVNGKEALLLCETEDFDLLLTDIFMPEMDGFELVSTLRAQGFAKPIIGVTAAMVGDETDRLLAAGADIVLPKPITRDKLERAWAEIRPEKS